MYKKLSAAFLATSLLWSPFSASAHVMNSDTMYTDIGQSEEKHAILYASALRLIANDANLFKPNDTLTRHDFAMWYAHFKQWDEEERQVIERAIKEGIISKAQGNVTYREVNDALLNGSVKLEHASNTMTRAAYADFVTMHANDKLKQGTLIEQLDYVEGPTGEIEAVAEKNEHYVLTIDGENYTLAEHPNIDNDSTDPRVWEGQTVTTSLLTKQTVSDRKGDGSVSDEAKLQYVAIGEADEVAKQQTTEKQTEHISVPVVNEKNADETEQSSSIGWWIGGGIIVVIAALLLLRTKKRGQ